MKIKDGYFSTRTTNSLLSAGVMTFEELNELSENQIARFRNIGRGSLEEILRKRKQEIGENEREGYFVEVTTRTGAIHTVKVTKTLEYISNIMERGEVFKAGKVIINGKDIESVLEIERQINGTSTNS